MGGIPPADLPAEVSTQAGPSQFRSDIFKQTPQYKSFIGVTHMDILDILGTSQGDAKNWVDELKNKNIHYGWIDRVNKSLDRLSKVQIELLRNKFKNISSVDRLIDKLSEVLVATEYGNDEPFFLDENSSGPDIFLKRTNQYIEVKNLNNSDIEKGIVEQMQKEKIGVAGGRVGSIESFITEDEAKYRLLLKKTKELLDKGVSQLSCKKGFIYFVYSVDFITPSLESKDVICERLKRDVVMYCKEKGVDVVTKKLSDFV